MVVENLKTLIKENRPNLSDGSLKTYSSIINNVMKKMKLNDMNELYEKADDIIEHLKDKNPAQRKTIYASFIVLLDKNKDADDAVEKYRKIMMNDGKKSLEDDEHQEKSSKQEANWESWNDIVDRRNKAEKDVKGLWTKKELSNEEYGRLMNFVILSLYTYIAPRRLIDFSEMRIRGKIDKDDDNYIEGDELVFNKYKTKGVYKTQRVEIPKELSTILKKWQKVNKDSEYLLTDNSRKNKLSAQTLINRLYNIFNKKISVSMLRHIYISNVLAKMPPLQELKKLSSEMGHSITQQILYKKL